MHPTTTFELSIDQNTCLPAGGRVMDAAISLRCAAGFADVTDKPTAAQVILIDCSGSMAGPKLYEAKRAAMAAVDALRDGVAFALVAGTAEAAMVYPSGEEMIPASAQTRAAAKEALGRLGAEGGTAIGVWLYLAGRLLQRQDATIKHAILLTDGNNEHETAEELLAVLRRYEGVFVCDSRGVGKNWAAEPLLAIRERLLGTAEGLLEPERLAQDFKAITERIMGKAVADVYLRLWVPDDVRVRLLKLISPQIIDLSGRGTRVDQRHTDYPTGQWGAETQVFHLSVEAPPGHVGETRAAARVSVVHDGQSLAEQTVWITWTADHTRSSPINAQVEHNRGQLELQQAMQEGLAAREAGDTDLAVRRLGRAVQLATASDHHETLSVLNSLVHVIDAASASVRLRSNVDAVHAEMANLQSHKTVAGRRDGQA